jgi:perosamine synthetase
VISFGEPQLDYAEEEAVSRVLASGQLSRGDECRAFEAEFGQIVGGRATVAVSSGTAALHLAMLAAGIGPGDEVIVPGLTYVATSNAVRYCGATPVLVEGEHPSWCISPRRAEQASWCISPRRAEQAITDRTKAIVAVHLYGHEADLPALELIVQRQERLYGRKIRIIEDCAQALGNPKVGLHLSAWSFYASKHITTGGEGGAVTSHRPEDIGRARHLATQAMTDKRYVHSCVGYNYRMTEIQAAIGRAQIRKLPRFMERRREILSIYHTLLDGSKAWTQSMPRPVTHAAWACAAMLRTHSGYSINAAEVGVKMAGQGIETRPFFPLPPWRGLPYRGVAFDTEEKLRFSGIVLPIHCGLRDGDVKKVCEELRRALD